MSNVSDYDIRHLAATNSKLAAINVRYRELYREQKLLFRADEYAVPVIAEKAKTLDDLVRVLPDGEKLETVSGGVVGETRAVTVDGTHLHCLWAIG